LLFINHYSLIILFPKGPLQAFHRFKYQQKYMKSFLIETIVYFKVILTFYLFVLLSFNYYFKISSFTSLLILCDFAFLKYNLQLLISPSIVY